MCTSLFKSVKNERFMVKPFRKYIGKFFTIFFLYILLVPSALALEECLIDFDDPFILGRLVNQAKDTFAVNSEWIYDDGEYVGSEACDLSDGGLCNYYFEFCTQGWFRVDPLAYGHYHLSDPDWDCYDFNTGGMGEMQGSNCVGPANYANAPRQLSTHEPMHVIEIWQASSDFNEGTERCVFDFLSMRILGTVPAKVQIFKSDVIYTWNSLPPGHWDFSAWGEDALYVRVRSADGEVTVITIDDIRMRG